MTVVVGTAGHIDHGKTSLLRALTGIDADRLPEEQRRGMTLDVGYAHLALPNGRVLDFVDVPGHDRLVGNMLVGAGEIDAALLVVAADDGPRAQTLEHLALLDALGIRDGLAVVTKLDLVPSGRLEEVRLATERLLGATCLAGAPVVAASVATGAGLEDVVRALVAVEAHVAARPAGGQVARLAIDRVFTIRGRGTVVTGSLRGSVLAAGETVRIEPGGASARIREVQVHGAPVAAGSGPGRTALNLAGVEAASLRRGQVVSRGPGIEVSNRLLVALRKPPAALMGADPRWPPADGELVRLHLGTEQVGARVGRAGRESAELPDGSWTAALRLETPITAAVGDRLVLRRPSPGEVVAGGLVLDPAPPRGLARRRVNPARLGALHAAALDGDGAAAIAALTDLHGALAPSRVAAIRAALEAAEAPPLQPHPSLAPDLADDLASAAMSMVEAHQALGALDSGAPLAELRLGLAARLRRATGIAERLAQAAVTVVLEDLVADGRLAREADRLRDPAQVPGPSPELRAAMDRLERLLSAPAPPPLSQAARNAGCPPEGIRALESAGRLVRVEADLAWATPSYQELAAQALSMARRGPLSPAAFRDATGTSRRYVLAILEDLDRRGILVRSPDGHRPGPRAPASPAGAVAP